MAVSEVVALLELCTTPNRGKGLSTSADGVLTKHIGEIDSAVERASSHLRNVFLNEARRLTDLLSVAESEPCRRFAVCLLAALHTFAVARGESVAEAQSVQQRATVRRALDLLVAVGVAPALAVGVWPSSPSTPAVRLVEAARRQLAACLHCAIDISRCDALAKADLLTGCLGALLAAWMQLNSDSGFSSTSELQESAECLFASAHPQLLVIALMQLQAGSVGVRSKPAWLLSACGARLTDVLTGTEGLRHVIQAMEESGGAPASDWRGAAALAKIVCRTPSTWRHRVADYVANVCAQLLALLRADADKYGRVAAAIGCQLWLAHPTPAEDYFFDRLIEPLLHADPGASAELAAAVRSVSAFYCNCPPGSSPPAPSHRRAAVGALVRVYADIAQSVSFTRTRVHDALVHFVISAEVAECVALFIEYVSRPHEDDLRFELVGDELIVRQPQPADDDLWRLLKPTDVVLQLLKELPSERRDEVVASLVLACMHDLTGEPGAGEKEKDAQLLRLTLLAELVNEFTEQFVASNERMLKLAVDIIKTSIHASSCVLAGQRLKIAIGIIGATALSGQADALLLCDCRSLLTSVVKSHADAAARQLAASVLPLLSLSSSAPAAKQTAPEHGFLEQCLRSLLDESVAERGGAIVELNKLIRRRDGATLGRSDELLQRFSEALRDDDSYVYLAAASALSSLAVEQADTVLPHLVDAFTSASTPDDEQLKIGEILSKSSRAFGELAPFYADRLIARYLALASTASDDVRVSALSCLAEICSLRSVALDAHFQDVLLCARQCLNSSSAKPAERLAALTVVRSLIRSAGDALLEAFGDAILDTYRMIKRVYAGDKDNDARLQAQLCLEEIDLCMRDQLALGKDG